MYPGWLALGSVNPWVSPNYHEIVNNARAHAYARWAGITWLHECNECAEVGMAIPGGSHYLNPKDDNAPWYDPENPDSEGFLGLIGIDVTGTENSTLHASVTSAITGGGVIGPGYYGPRTMVLRGIAIATDECSLQYGLEWMRFEAGLTEDPCLGDTLTFFDCCPCVCESTTPGGPCWAQDYEQLSTLPYCADDFPAYITAPTTTVESADALSVPTPESFVVRARVRPSPTDPSDMFSIVEVQAGPDDPDVTWSIVYDHGTGYWRVVLASPTMSTQTLWVQSNVVVDQWNEVAVAVRVDVPTLTWTVASFVNDGEMWTNVGSASETIPSSPFQDPRGAPGSPDIGSGSPDERIDISWVDMLDGDNPDSGTLLWRMNAAAASVLQDTWVDSRGATWTMSSVAGLTPSPLWWPSTYQELKDGPPMPDEDWCSWPDIYFELDHGPPSFACCVDACVIPYVRRFDNVRVTEGPVVLSHPAMNTCGAMLEFELTIVAADPFQRMLSEPLLNGMTLNGDALQEDAEEPELVMAGSDPFARGPSMRSLAPAVSRPPTIVTRSEWARDEFVVPPSTYGRTLSWLAPVVKLRTEPGGAASEVRIGFWSGHEQVGGFWLPHLPANSIIEINSASRRVHAIANGEVRELQGFVRAYDGAPVAWPRLHHGSYRVTVDQVPDVHIPLRVDVAMTQVGA